MSCPVGSEGKCQIWAMEFTDQDHGFLINSLTHWHYTYMIVRGSCS